MLNTDFEADANLLGAGIELSNDDDGRILANAVEAEDFDPRVYNDIEGLLYLGKLTSNVTIYGHAFVLKTLTRGERLAVTLVTKEYEDTLGEADALQTALVAASIITVDGRPLYLPLSPEDDGKALDRVRIHFEHICKWYDPLLEALYAEIGLLLLRQANAFAKFQGN